MGVGGRGGARGLGGEISGRKIKKCPLQFFIEQDIESLVVFLINIVIKVLWFVILIQNY